MCGHSLIKIIYATLEVLFSVVQLNNASRQALQRRKQLGSYKSYNVKWLSLITSCRTSAEQTEKL